MVLELIYEFIQKLICKRWYFVDNLFFFHQKCMFQYDEELKLPGPTNDLTGSRPPWSAWFPAEAL